MNANWFKWTHKWWMNLNLPSARTGASFCLWRVKTSTQVKDGGNGGGRDGKNTVPKTYPAACRSYSASQALALPQRRWRVGSGQGMGLGACAATSQLRSV